MYSFLLMTHSWLRWVILILGLVAIVMALSGWLKKGDYQKLDNAIDGSFVGFMHLQLFIGLILYFFLSPITASAFQDFGAAMKNAAVRYWAVEHLTVMILAVVLTQLGRSKAKRTADAVKKHKLTFIYYGIAYVLILSRIPWTEAARLFRSA